MNRGDAMLRDRRGTVAIAFSVALPVLLMFVGGTVDFARALLLKRQLQGVVDSSALAAARELSMADARRENIGAVVEAMVARMLALNEQQGASPTLATAVRDEPLEVEVVARQKIKPLFGTSLGLLPTKIEVSAVARIVGRPNICLLVLEGDASNALDLRSDARLTGQSCAIFSNSRNPNGISSTDSATLTASLICSAGGVSGGTSNFAPQPLVDCPTFTDPLASRPEPVVEPCNSNLPQIIISSKSLQPGTYCGGLTVLRGAQVTLEPGIYTMKNGPLLIADDATLIGSGVGFFLTGVGSTISFARRSHIDLKASASGSMAGLLIFESRRQKVGGFHNILSDDARQLLGTIYLPRGQLNIDANAPIADKSAYTAIVTRTLTLFGGPNLILNTNYGLTDIPVPEGIKGVNQPVSLVK